MRIIRSIEQMSAFSKNMRLRHKTIGFVPTMGALHQGHLSLIRQACRDNDKVVVSIFVNPIQFGPQDDFKKYPRDLRRDARLCKEEGVDIIFYPATEDMYPCGYKTYMEVEDLSDVLCGKFRPGHFRGVTTVVLKLFNMVNPDIAYFGQKDAQQAIIIKKMACDLNLGVKIKVMPTVREKDGLALSSRNVYLSPQERQEAVILFQALNLAKALSKQGNRDSLAIIRKMRRLIETKKSARVQYIAIVGSEDLKPVEKIRERVLIALAVWIGKTHLIDNIIINPNVKVQNPK